MEFNREFFEDEVRSGFYVSTMIKRGWAASLEVLSEIDRICKLENITYFAQWGTLIGAIRHDGFIPWDDDIDLAMTRPNYEKFLKVAPRYLPKGYVIHNIYSDDMYGPAISCVLNDDYINTSEEFLIKNHGCPAPIGVDIAVIDYFPRKTDEQEQLYEALLFLISLREQYSELTDEEKARQLDLVFDSIGTRIITNDVNKSVTYQLGLLIEQVCQLYSDEDADDYVFMVYYEKYHSCNFPKNWIDKVIDHKFENTIIPVPIEFDLYLKSIFGDYLKIVKNTSVHNYPYFESNYIKGKKLLEFSNYVPKTITVPRNENVLSDSEKTLVIFVCTRVKKWEKMHSVYSELVNNYPNAQVYVMPVPYFVKDDKGNAIDLKYEGNMYSDELKLIDYSEYDLCELHPDRIYFQDPYDEYNEIIQLPEEYCSSRLVECCDLLCYVASDSMDCDEDAFSKKNMCASYNYPGIFFADKIFISPEKIQYVLNALTEYTGESTKYVWEQKLLLN